MTALEVYNATLIELNKVNAPTFTVEHFNYFMDKVIRSFTNERYNLYAVNQQMSDDLRVLLDNVIYPDTGTALDTVVSLSPGAQFYQKFYIDDYELFEVGDILSITGSDREHTVTEANSGGYLLVTPDLPQATGQAGSVVVGSIVSRLDTSIVQTGEITKFKILKANYMHLLSCEVTWLDSTGLRSKTFPAKHLTLDMLTNIQTNAYLKPSFRQPYYLLRDNTDNTGIAKQATGRKQYQNRPLVEMYLGSAITGTTLSKVRIDYLKLPETVVLSTSEAYVDTSDTSQVLEFPDYLKNEFVKRLTTNFLENVGNPRVNTQVQINQEVPPIPLELQQGK